MDFLDCKICNITYDEDGHRPRNAPCGHGLCTACVGALIKDSILECPKCIQKHRVNVPEDLQINFDLIDVIRASRTNNIYMPKETSSKTSGATNDEVCNIHNKAINHWCLKCQISICEDCLATHISLIGCSTTTSTKALESIKEKSIKDIDELLTPFEVDMKHVSSMIQEHTNKKKEFLKMAEEHGKNKRKLCSLLEEGNINKEKLIESKAQLTEANSFNAVNSRIKIVTQRKQILRVWSLKNLGTDNLLDLSMTLIKENNVYAEMVIKGEWKHAKISQQDKGLYFHTFLKQTISDGCTAVPFDHLQRKIPDEASLVFMELSLGSVVKGKVLVRLDNNLPRTRDHVIQAFTGQQGKSLAGVAFDSCDRDWLRTEKLPFSEMKFTPDTGGRCKAKTDEVMGRFGNRYLSNIYFFPPKQFSDVDIGRYVFGKIEKGMDIVKECYDNYSNANVKISDCGLVIEQK